MELKFLNDLHKIFESSETVSDENVEYQIVIYFFTRWAKLVNFLIDLSLSAASYLLLNICEEVNGTIRKCHLQRFN